MATTNITVTPGDAQTTALAQAGSSTDGTLVSGQLRTALVEVTFGSTDHAADDVINLVRLPKGATILPDGIRVRVTDAIGDTSVLIDVGDDDDEGVGSAADADRYLDGTAITSAGLATNTVGAAAATLYTLSKSSWIQATIKAISNAEAGEVRFEIPYVIRN